MGSASLWLQQVHGNRVINSEECSADATVDACYIRQCTIVCAVLSADCLPLLACNKDGSQIAAVHLGWRGLCAGNLDEVIARFATGQSNILAWIGPHIRAENYEVGEDVRQACLQAYPGTDHAFSYSADGLWLASLDALVRNQLVNRGISMIYVCDKCTYDGQN